MRMLDPELWFCVDCTALAVNGDAPEDPAVARRCARGLRELSKDGQSVAANWDSESGDGVEEFSRRDCDCCGTALAGSRDRFALFTTAPMPAREAAELQRERDELAARAKRLDELLDAAADRLVDAADTIAELAAIAPEAPELRARWTLDAAAELAGDCRALANAERP